MTTPSDPGSSLFAKPSAEPTPPAPTPAELQASLEALRRVIHLSLGTLIVLLAGLNLYLFHQVRVVRSQAVDLTRQVTEMAEAVNDYTTNTGPRLERVLSELHRYGDAHSDFGQIMARYPRPATAAARKPAAPPSASPPPPSVSGPNPAPQQPSSLLGR